MSEYIARNLYSSQGIINYPTQLHLVGHFRKLLPVLLNNKLGSTYNNHRLKRGKVQCMAK